MNPRQKLVGLPAYPSSLGNDERVSEEACYISGVAGIRVQFMRMRACGLVILELSPFPEPS